MEGHLAFLRAAAAGGAQPGRMRPAWRISRQPPPRHEL